LPRLRPLRALQNVWVAVTLTWIGGYVDIVGYLSIYGLYTAHMSGNTVSMARSAVIFNWYDLARYGWAVICFVLGLVLGGITFEAQRRNALRTRIPLTLAFEFILLAGFVVGAGLTPAAPDPPIRPQPDPQYYLMIALLALAMGIQNVTIRKVGGINVYTTFVTGTLVKFAEALSSYLFWLHDRLRFNFPTRLSRVARLSWRQPSMRHVILTGALWLAYFVGAICGVLALTRFSHRSLIFPLLLLIVLSIYAAIARRTFTEEEDL
jgi:uncharacterized membrane protein YoaK (UPF0700 family)